MQMVVAGFGVSPGLFDQFVEADRQGQEHVPATRANGAPPACSELLPLEHVQDKGEDLGQEVTFGPRGH
eukprot:9398435-Lingulodinium_polyedra.AAC.1